MAHINDITFLINDANLFDINFNNLTISELNSRLVETTQIIDEATELKFQIQHLIKLKYTALLNSDKKFYDIHKIAILDDSVESDSIERIGGWPSLADNETWPLALFASSSLDLTSSLEQQQKPLIFVAQFIYNDNILYRLFMDEDIMSNYYRCMPIKLDKLSVNSPSKVSETYSYISPLKKYNIIGYNQHKEFKPYCELQHHIDISEELYDDIDMKNNASIGNCAIVMPFFKYEKKIDDRCPLFKISAQLLERPNDGGEFFFFHQEKLVYVP